MSEVFLWLDTSILRRWNLQLATPEADKFFKFSQEWGFRLLLPEVVLSEFVQHYVREAEGVLHAIERSKGSLAPLEIPVAEGPWAHRPADLAAYYREILERRCSEKSITIVPVGRVPAKRLLDMSVRRIPPFTGEKGERGLHDTLVLFTILQYAHQNQQFEMSLISGDRIFQDENVKALAEQSGVHLFVHESVDAFIAYINTLVDKVDQKVRLEREARVRSFLLDHKQEIEGFVEQTAVFGEAFLGGIFVEGTIKGVIGISFDDITEVNVFPVESEETETTLLFITFTVRLKMLVETEVSRWPSLFEPKRFRVGLEPEKLARTFDSPERKTQQMIRDVVCEATAKEHVDKKTLSSLNLKEVKAGTPFEALTGFIKRGQAPPGLFG